MLFKKKSSIKSPTHKYKGQTETGPIIKHQVISISFKKIQKEKDRKLQKKNIEMIKLDKKRSPERKIHKDSHTKDQRWKTTANIYKSTKLKT